MALRGNLKDFSLPDVFQLAAFSRKTGVLRISRAEGATGSVWFRNGDVFFASSNWRKEFLGQRMVRAERITPHALERALEIQAQEPAGGRRLGQILVDEGYITQAVLEAFVSEQIQDTIFDLMRWDEGQFDFEAMPEPSDEDIGLSVSIENVVMEGSRRLEEWNRIRRKIPSTDVVFKMATAPGEGTFEISLKPVEWQLLLLTDGTRSVSQMAEETGRTDFDVARVLYGLCSAGLLEFASDDEIERNRAERAQREARLAEAEQPRAETEVVGTTVVVRPLEPRTVAVAAEPTPELAEEPEFLSGPTREPTAEDQAVLAEFMGAVLQQPKPVTPPAPIEAPAPQAPVPVEEAPVAPVPETPKAAELYTPAEEPAFIVSPATPESEEPIDLSSIGELLGIEPTVPAPAEPESEPAADIVEVSAPPPEIEELPVPVPEVVAPPPEIVVEEPAELAAEPVAEEPPPATDFAELLESLESEAEIEEHEVSQHAPAEASAADEPIAEETAAPQPSVGAHAESAPPVVSEPEPNPLTERFPERRVGELAFSGGLADELSALTGAKRPTSRPQASVRAIPDADGASLTRDRRVDRETLMKIIDGIKGL